MLADIVWDKNTLTVVMLFSIPLVAIIAGTWYKLEKMRSSDSLKRKMVERGMSVEEIERVIAAGPKDDD